MNRNLNPLYLEESVGSAFRNSLLGLLTLFGANGIRSAGNYQQVVQPELRRIVQGTNEYKNTIIQNIIKSLKKVNVADLSLEQISKIQQPDTLYYIISKSNNEKALEIIKNLNIGTIRKLHEYAKSGGLGFIPSPSSLSNYNRISNLIKMSGHNV